MERNTQKSALINLLALLVVGATAFAVARTSGSAAAYVSAVFVGLGFLVTAVSWFQMRLEERERLEKLELEELARKKSASALFESKDAEVFPAQRSREQFERFLVPIFTAVLFVAQAAGAFLLWRWLSRTGSTEVKQPTVVLAAFGLVALVSFLLGKFSATIARLGNDRLLRPGAGWLLLNAYLAFVVALGAVGLEAGFPKADYYVALGLCALLGLIALETLVALVLEIYRPRLKGRVARPLYESRVVGLLGQPEGLITTAAQALDYQFGFKVSETWFYRFFERAIAWLLLLQLGALLLSTSMVFIDLGEQGLLERFGRPVPGRTLLDPGAHLKWPWPIDRVYRYRTEQIQSFNVGYAPDPKLANQNTVLWTIPHANEQNFLVASREQVPTAEASQASGRTTPPVSLLTVSIPVQFQITNLLDWAYQNDNPSNLLQSLAEREVVRYLASADLNDIMSRRQSEAAETLRGRIQAAVAERRLGARILFVGLQDIHPPVKVAPEYEKVVGAGQTRLGKILDARADDIKTNALARATAVTLTNRAWADATRIEIGALAQAALFTNQIPAYEAAPSVYMERSYLQMFARATAKAPKYIVLTTNSQDVLQFDLQQRIPTDFLNLSVTPQKK